MPMHLSIVSFLIFLTYLITFLIAVRFCSKRSILSNFPLLGRFRFLESIRPELDSIIGNQMMMKSLIPEIKEVWFIKDQKILVVLDLGSLEKFYENDFVWQIIQFLRHILNIQILKQSWTWKKFI